MSAAAVEKLQQIWKKLEFARVARVIAREPEDVGGINVHNYSENGNGYWTRQSEGNLDSKRPSEIPAEDRWQTEVEWRHYYGFTHNNIYFQKDGCCRLDVDLLFTLDFGLYGNHCDIWGQKPDSGALIAGETVMTPKGKKFCQWFVCSPEFLALYTAVMIGTAPSELNVFAQKLVTDDLNWHDAYIPIAALVLYDDVKFFVDMLDRQSRPYHDQPVDLLDKQKPEITHPCHNQPFGKTFQVAADKFTRNIVYWNDVHVPGYDTSAYVHTLAHLLEPNWWTTFTEMAGERDLDYSHTNNPFCIGCQEGVPV